MLLSSAILGGWPWGTPLWPILSSSTSLLGALQILQVFHWGILLQKGKHDSIPPSQAMILQQMSTNSAPCPWMFPGLTHRNDNSNNYNNIPLFTLGSIYSTIASGAEQMSETNNSNPASGQSETWTGIQCSNHLATLPPEWPLIIAKCAKFSLLCLI